ncbi:S-layer homology domain-containing protein [Cohnella boryungensis]|uniref:S-layer homology domain-containing protein n=1 Tax=Cohnella boryungensis TaxID=768479 RepID=A0ABV8S835_9BACL
MKKSLSLLLSFALVFGLFASMASAADTQLTTAEKYKVLVDKGILKGTTTGNDGLGDNLTRAQFATIAIALAGLQAEKPATATFTDVKSSEWWYGAIEAAAKAGLVEGTGAGKFTPRADVTVESVIKIAVTIAKIEPVKDAKVEGASDWAGPYIQAALDKGLIPAGLDYKSNATRGQSIDVVYPVYLGQQEPAKVSVASAKATGVKEVTVALDKAVDTAKATFTLKKGAVSVALNATKWSDDKKTAVLPLKDVKISEGEYTVTLAGLEADAIDKNSGTFTATNEKVEKIEFVTASDEIAYSAKAKVKVKASNQYGEQASYPSSAYSVFTGYTGLGERVTKDDEGYLIIELNTNVNSITQNVSQIPLTIYYNETRVMAAKTFKVGNAPFVTKIELGDVKYDGTKTSLTTAGETAIVPIKLYDQYGNPITKDQVAGSTINFNQFIQPHAANLTATTDDFDNDNYFETKVVLAKKEAKAATYTLSVYAGGTSATASINVGAGKVATKVGFGEFSNVLASGDTSKAYIPIVAYDNEGNQLTKDELVDSVNAARVKVSVSGPVVASNTIIASGPNKGSVEITSVNANTAKSTVFITASIAEIDAQDFKTMNINIQEARQPETLVIDSSSAVKAVLGANSDFKILIQDQYGKKYSNLAGYQVDVTLINTDGTPAITLLGRDSNVAKVGTAVAGAPAISYTNAEGSQFNDGFTFDTTASVYGKVQFKAELIKLATGTAPQTSLKVVTQTIESIDPSKVDLTYSLKDPGALFAAKDSGLLPSGFDAADTSRLAKAVTIEVKDTAGNSVAFPGDLVQTVSSSNGLAVVYDQGTGVTNENDADKFYLLGNKAGTSTVTATVYSAKGEIVSASGTVTVKADAVAVETISAGNGDKQAAANTYNAYDLMDLKVVDNYGIEYKATNIDRYKKLLGVTYTVTNVKGTGSVSLNSGTNQVTINGTVTEFLLTAQAPNGKTTTTLVYN